MNNFVNVKIRERLEGAPGFMEFQEIEVTINADKITLFNKGEDPRITFVRLECGATLCVAMPYKEFTKLIGMT